MVWSDVTVDIPMDIFVENVQDYTSDTFKSPFGPSTYWYLIISGGGIIIKHKLPNGQFYGETLLEAPQEGRIEILGGDFQVVVPSGQLATTFFLRPIQ